MDTIVLGEGVLGWAAEERQSNRYGLIHLNAVADTDYENYLLLQVPREPWSVGELGEGVVPECVEEGLPLGGIEMAEEILLGLLCRGRRTQAELAPVCGKGRPASPPVPRIRGSDNQPFGLEGVKGRGDDGLVDLDERGQLQLGHRRGHQRNPHEVFFEGHPGRLQGGGLTLAESEPSAIQ